jgi:Rps23 Pro-64 3,4-dihydroxylase Tpa1-like proline 4-hydroxylase
MQEVSVTLLLNGGHSRTLAMKPEDPLLHALLTTIQEKGAGQWPSRPYHLRLDEGRQSLIFAGADLVGLITDPPIQVQAAPRPAAAIAASGPVKSRYALIENFLAPEQHRALLEYVGREQGRFADSTVSTNDPDYRRSKILYEFPEFAELFRRKVAAAAPQVLPALGMQPFPVHSIEAQLTAHNDGNYFRLHNDSGSPDTATRALTYVYYFHNEPKRYSGGEFRLYDSVLADGRYGCGPVAGDIEPKNNSVLFFASHCHHEVLPVRVPSNRFEDGRFTVNGWVRRAA